MTPEEEVIANLDRVAKSGTRTSAPEMTSPDHPLYLAVRGVLNDGGRYVPFNDHHPLRPLLRIFRDDNARTDSLCQQRLIDAAINQSLDPEIWRTRYIGDGAMADRLGPESQQKERVNDLMLMLADAARLRLEENELPSDEEVPSHLPPVESQPQNSPDQSSTIEAGDALPEEELTGPNVPVQPSPGRPTVADRLDRPDDSQSPAIGPEASPKSRSPLGKVLLAAGAGVLITALVIVLIWAQSSIRDSSGQGAPTSSTTTEPSTTTPSSTTSSTSTSTSTSFVPSSAQLTFDDLGGGSSIIAVYPGYTSSARDTEPNGTYAGGQDATAICVASGRTVNSHPEQGERTLSSDKWIRITGSPGNTQYASAVYVKDSQALIDVLPACT